MDSTSASVVGKKLELLYSGLKMTVPVIEQFKEILALQWMLGNIFLIVLFLIALKAYYYSGKALKAFKPDYKLPRRWLYGMIGFMAVSLFFFNAMPKWIDINVPQNRTISSTD